MIAGFATAAGTERYGHRFPNLRDAGHFRRPDWVPGPGELWLSSIGLGTYLGDPTSDVDRSYADAIAAALRGGINVLDSAINYRHQRSERNIRAALEQLVASGEVQRDEILVCTKGGYLSFDTDMPADPRAYFIDEYVKRGVLDLKEVVNMHCMAPGYLADQLERSRRNLGLETIDVYYVHNPESQLEGVAPAVFVQRLKDAFAMLEQAVAAGKIRWYGTATWNAYRVAAGQPGSMPLSAVIDLAEEVGGRNHHFRFIQLPFNLAMPEAFAARNQKTAGEDMSTLELARRAGIAVVASAALHQGHLTEGLPEFIGKRLGLRRDSENALQFARSAPGIVTALIGMSRREHVECNLMVAAHPPAPLEQWSKLFRAE